MTEERRSSGLPVWQWKIGIKDLLSDDPTDKVAVSVGAEIAKRLRHGLPGLADGNNDAYDIFGDLLYNLEHIESVEHLNVMLDELYDWADTNRLWLGL